MAANTSGQQYCEKCRKTMAADTNFYTYKDGSKCELCKSCLTMHINNFEPDTFLWLLEKFDVPYIEAEWNVLRDRAYQKDPYKMNGMSVFGKYLSKMKLKQWREYTWADTEKLKAKAEMQAKLYGAGEGFMEEEQRNVKEAYERGEISEAQYKTYTEIHAPEPTYGKDVPNAANGFHPVNSPYEEIELDIGNDLTQEDKIYLAMKWGRLYRPDEWVALEQLYTEFMQSFDIQGAARIDTLKMICKTSLKMNQAIDCGDIESYQKLSRVYDSMMKSAKFTEAQNKDGQTDAFDSIGALVAFCEKEGGFIPRFEIKAPLDSVDITIADMKEYTRSLINADTGLAQQIEQYIKKKEIAEEQKKTAKMAKEMGEDAIALTDKDYQEYYDELEKDKEKDYKTLYGLNDEEDED